MVLTGASEEALTVLWTGKPGTSPGPLFKAPVSARIRQILVTSSRRGGTLSLQVVRAGSGGRPDDPRAEVLASALPVDPGAVVELIGMTAAGYLPLWAGDVIWGHQDPAGALQVLAYGAADHE